MLVFKMSVSKHFVQKSRKKKNAHISILPMISLKLTNIFAMHVMTLEVVYAGENSELSLTITSSESTYLL